LAGFVGAMSPPPRLSHLADCNSQVPSDGLWGPSVGHIASGMCVPTSISSLGQTVLPPLPRCRPAPVPVPPILPSLPLTGHRDCPSLGELELDLGDLAVDGFPSEGRVQHEAPELGGNVDVRIPSCTGSFQSAVASTIAGSAPGAGCREKTSHYGCSSSASSSSSIRKRMSNSHAHIEASGQTQPFVSGTSGEISDNSLRSTISFTSSVGPSEVVEQEALCQVPAVGSSPEPGNRKQQLCSQRDPLLSASPQQSGTNNPLTNVGSRLQAAYAAYQAAGASPAPSPGSQQQQKQQQQQQHSYKWKQSSQTETETGAAPATAAAAAVAAITAGSLLPTFASPRQGMLMTMSLPSPRHEPTEASNHHVVWIVRISTHHIRNTMMTTQHHPAIRPSKQQLFYEGAVADVAVDVVAAVAVD